ncbi:MAG: hypothetical protein ACREUC_13795 [Steroidobacteraceae bacterium]
MSPVTVRNALVLAGVAVASAIVGGLIAGPQAAPHAKEEPGKLQSDDKLQPEDWLLGASSDTERFRLIQQQLRGFDQPMWEVGERWARIHDSLMRGNYELALFHWWKIEQTISNAIVKRPQRAANARAFFLDKNYERIRAGFESRDPQRAWTAFNDAKSVCQACHLAEQSGFVNDTAVFDLAPPKAYARMNNDQNKTGP